MFDCGNLRQGKYLFRFENRWLGAEGFIEKVKTWWSSY
jgi:hypothetical protein